MDATEFKNLREALRVQYEIELKALEKFYRMSPKSPEPAASNGIPAMAAEPHQERGKNPPPTRTGITDIVKGLLPTMPDKFTLADLAKKIELASPGWGSLKERVSASGVLIRMCRKGLLTPIRKGKGKAPSIYSKVVKDKE